MANDFTAYDEEYDEGDACLTCDGSGERNVCCDDMCQGLGECIHGDGMIVCNTCGGAGYI